MAAVEFRLNRAGVREILRGGGSRRLVDGVAKQVAGHVRAHLPSPAPVEVTSYITDRAAASVTVLDVRSMAWQANHGIMTRAAASVGAEVKAWQR